MEKLNDEKIQNMLENGINTGNDYMSASEKEMFNGYQSLFHDLGTEPVQGLPFNFALKATLKLKLKLKRKSDIRFNILAAFGIVFAFAAFYGILMYVNADTGNQFLTAVIKYKWLLISSSLIILCTLIFDQAKVEKLVI